MVQTRRSTQKPTTTSPTKSITKDNHGKRKKLPSNLDRCKNWIQQQKKEKPKVQPDEIDSNESDEEARDLNLATISDGSANDGTITRILSCCEWQRCQRFFENHSEFREHVLGHLDSNEEIYKCEWDLCAFDCNDFVVFKRHVGYHIYITRLKTTGEQLLHKRPMPACLIPSRSRNLIPNTDAKYVCMWQDCSYTFDMVEDYYDHARSHCVYELDFNKQGNRNKAVQCKWVSCKKMFDKRQKMTDHMRTHTGERFVACLNCGSTFNSYVKFYDHFRRQALNKSYKCYQCFQSFNTEELLNNHTAAHVNRVKCTECDMTCPSNAALAQHFRYRHLKERPYKCSECDYASVTKWDLSKHQTRMHAIEQTTYICEECEYSCLTMAQMRKHARDEHGDGANIYCCHCCEVQYKNGSSLSKHLIRKHGFRLPSGHTRFTYQMDINGVYRVQTTRIESLEVSKQIMATSANDIATNKNVTYSLSEFVETPEGIKLSVLETAKPIEPPKTSQKLDVKPNKIPAVKLPSTKESKREFSENRILNEIGSIDSNTFMESLNLKSIQSNTTTMDAISSGAQKILPKNIDNFSVIKKYAKKKRQKTRATCIIEEYDVDGNMMKTHTVPCETEIDTSI